MGLFSKKPSLPAQVRLYAVGDIHGCLDPLRQVIKLIRSDATLHPAKVYRLVFLGDYIDRGLHAAQVLDFLIDQLPPFMEKIFIRGNHDDVMLQFLDGDLSVLPGWLTYGGMATLASYGVNLYQPREKQEQEALRSSLLAKIPASHRAFLETTRTSYSCGDYFFAHAGVKPNVPLSEQSSHDLMWMRGGFLQSTLDHGKVIVHGHTISPEPDVQPNRIGIDTGAFASGHLTCLVLEGKSRSFLKT
jgi:serine/threonine protein phosphatase 1